MARGSSRWAHIHTNNVTLPSATQVRLVIAHFCTFEAAIAFGPGVHFCSFEAAIVLGSGECVSAPSRRPLPSGQLSGFLQTSESSMESCNDENVRPREYFRTYEAAIALGSGECVSPFARRPLPSDQVGVLLHLRGCPQVK